MVNAGSACPSIGVIWAPSVVDNDVLPLAEVVRSEPQPLSGLQRFRSLEPRARHPAGAAPVVTT